MVGLIFAAYKALRMVNANVGSNAYTGTVEITWAILGNFPLKTFTLDCIVDCNSTQ